MINAANKTIVSSPLFQKDTKWPPKDFYWGSKSSISEMLGTIFFNRVNRAQEIVSHLNTSLPSLSVKRNQLNIFFFQLSPGDPIHYWGAIKVFGTQTNSKRQMAGPVAITGSSEGWLLTSGTFRSLWHTSFLILTSLIFAWQLAVHNVLGLVIISSCLRLHIWYL